MSTDENIASDEAQPLTLRSPPSAAAEADSPLSPASALATCSVLAAVTALKSLLQARAVEAAGGRLAYSTFSLTLIVEGAKLAASALLAAALRERSWPPAREALLYALPGALYAIDNNLVFDILRYIDAATLAVLWNVKIVFTALLLRLLLGRRLLWRQWLALALLTAGVSVSNWPRLWTAVGDRSRAGSAAYAAGALMSLAACAIVSLANVAEEKLLKSRLATPLHCQNCVLYGWGVAFNACALVSRGAPAGGANLSVAGLFRGLDGYAAAIIGTQALSGILVSATFKHVSNIAALYAHAMSMVLIAACTPAPSDSTASANALFVLGMAIVVLSLVGFYEREAREGCARASERCAPPQSPHDARPRRGSTALKAAGPSPASPGSPHGGASARPNVFK